MIMVMVGPEAHGQRFGAQERRGPYRHPSADSPTWLGGSPGARRDRTKGRSAVFVQDPPDLSPEEARFPRISTTVLADPLQNDFRRLVVAHGHRLLIAACYRDERAQLRD